MARLCALYPSLTIEQGVVVKGETNITFGKNVILQSHAVLHGGGMPWCNFTGSIMLGDDTCISPGCVLYGAGARLLIGRNFDCGPGTKIFTSSTDFERSTGFPQSNMHRFADVIIGDNVVCFSNVVISPGVVIGQGAVIGAGSIILKDVEPHTFVAGVPACVVRHLPTYQ